MKIFTEKQFDKLLYEHSRKLSEVKKEGFDLGYEKGKHEGYNKGLHEGLTKNKEGVVFTSSGLYHFKDNETTEALTSDGVEIGRVKNDN